MRHRIGGQHTGLGNPFKEVLTNNLSKNKKFNTLVKEMLFEAITTFPLMKQTKGCDFQIYDDIIEFGIEPAYQYEDLEIIALARNKLSSYIQKGHAWGTYGSDIASRTKYYSDYKLKSKFVRFIDKWHQKLYISKE